MCVFSLFQTKQSQDDYGTPRTSDYCVVNDGKEASDAGSSDFNEEHNEDDDGNDCDGDGDNDSNNDEDGNSDVQRP